MFLGFNTSFTLEHPLRTSPPTDAAYPVYCERLWDVARTGESTTVRRAGDIIEKQYAGLGWHVNPAYVAWHGLMNHAHGVRFDDGQALESALRTATWLASAATTRNGFIGWDYPFDWPHFGHTLQAGWRSGLAQALGASMLFRAATQFDKPAWAALAHDALAIFRAPLADGGLRTSLDGHAYFEEYPTEPATYVLDGFLFTLVAFHDSVRAGGRSDLLDEASATLAATLHNWEWNGVWSRYGARGPLCSLEYHMLNLALLRTARDITGDSTYDATVSHWETFAQSAIWRARITCSYYLGNALHTLREGGGIGPFINRKLAERSHRIQRNQERPS